MATSYYSATWSHFKNITKWILPLALVCGVQGSFLGFHIVHLKSFKIAVNYVLRCIFLFRNMHHKYCHRHVDSKEAQLTQIIHQKTKLCHTSQEIINPWIVSFSIPSLIRDPCLLHEGNTLTCRVALQWNAAHWILWNNLYWTNYTTRHTWPKQCPDIQK